MKQISAIKCKLKVIIKHRVKRGVSKLWCHDFVTVARVATDTRGGALSDGAEGELTREMRCKVDLSRRLSRAEGLAMVYWLFKVQILRIVDSSSYISIRGWGRCNMGGVVGQAMASSGVSPGLREEELLIGTSAKGSGRFVGRRHLCRNGWRRELSEALFMLLLLLQQLLLISESFERNRGGGIVDWRRDEITFFISIEELAIDVITTQDIGTYSSDKRLLHDRSCMLWSNSWTAM